MLSNYVRSTHLLEHYNSPGGWKWHK
jgi:hypothetical protein